MHSHPHSFSRRRHPRARRAAFTLIELLAVVAAMAMLLAFTLPILRGGNNMNKTAWDFAGVIEQGRAYAQAQNTYVWVGFNMSLVSDTDPSTSQAATHRIAAFLIASRDGTSGQTEDNLEHIDRVRVEENVAFVDPGTGAASAEEGFSADAYPNRATSNVFVCTPASFTQAISGIPDTVRYRKRTVGGSNVELATANFLLEIAPDGSLRPNGSNGYHWIEMGLRSYRGSAEVPGETSLIQISSLTGRVQVMRPGSFSSAAAEGGDQE